MEERILLSIILLGIEKKGTLSFESIVCGAFFFIKIFQFYCGSVTVWSCGCVCFGVQLCVSFI